LYQLLFGVISAGTKPIMVYLGTT